MNSAKKILKNQGLGTQNRAKEESKGDFSSRKNMILIVIGLVLIVGFSAIVAYIQLRPRAILTVTGKDANNQEVVNTVYFKDSAYDILTAETYYTQLYQQFGGGDYWSTENVDGKGNTGAEATKKQVMDQIKMREILYMEAKKNNVELTDEEKQEVTDNLSQTRENMTDKQKKMSGLDEDSIRAVLEKQAYADKYKQQVIDGLDIDDAKLKEGVSKKDYRQYTLQYYTISKMETKEGAEEETKKSAEDLKKAASDMKALRDKAAKASDFTKDIITDSDNDSQDDETGISYGTQNLLETNTTFLDEKTRKKVKKMKNNTVSGVLETDDAYYVVKMVNNNDPEAYNAQCEQVVSDEEQSKFSEKYEADIKTAYKTDVQSYWKQRVTLGNLTLDVE